MALHYCDNGLEPQERSHFQTTSPTTPSGSVTRAGRVTPYQDLGNVYFEEHNRHAVERRLTRRLERLSYRVTLELVAA